MKVCHAINQRSANEAMDQMDEVRYGLKDGKTINDHKVIKQGTTW
jgi:hypothetical protein